MSDNWVDSATKADCQVLADLQVELLWNSIRQAVAAASADAAGTASTAGAGATAASADPRGETLGGVDVASAAETSYTLLLNEALQRIDRQQIVDSLAAQVAGGRPDAAVFCARQARLVEPVGFVVFAPAESIEVAAGRDEAQPLGAGLEIGSLVVADAHRGEGHGSRLLEAVVKRAKSLMLGSLRCWISADNQAVQRFFGGAGFAPAGQRRQLDLGGLPYAEHLWYTRL